MKTRALPALALLLCCRGMAAPMPAPVYTLLRIADMADGAPAFVILGPDRRIIKRIECIQNGWVRSDELAARLLGSTAVMAAIAEKRGQVAAADLGPAMHDCVASEPG